MIDYQNSFCLWFVKKVVKGCAKVEQHVLSWLQCILLVFFYLVHPMKASKATETEGITGCGRDEKTETLLRSKNRRRVVRTADSD